MISIKESASMARQAFKTKELAPTETTTTRQNSADTEVHLTDAPIINRARVEYLKAEIANNQYEPNSYRMAMKLLDQLSMPEMA